MKLKLCIPTILLLLFFSLVGCSSSPVEPHPETLGVSEHDDETVAVSEAAGTKTVEIMNAEGKKIGVALLKEEKGGVRLQVEVSQLAPGNHGYHIHEKTFQGTDFATAGAHFNPTGKEHGLKNPKGAHLGDMHNLRVKEDGTAVQTEYLEGASLKKDHPHSLIGRSIIIHKDEDNQVTNPAGNSGDRVAGGNIL